MTEEEFNKQFTKPPSCLDAAYERKAMWERMNSNPVFDENKLNEYPDNSKDR
jgi:hypothetical protein